MKHRPQFKKYMRLSYAIPLLLLAVFSVGYITYCNYIMTECPWQTWFDNQMISVNSLKQGTLTWKDISLRAGENGLLGYMLLLFVNVTFFGMKTMFEVQVNNFVVFLCGALLLWKMYRSAQKEWSKGWFWTAALLLCAVNFNPMQGSSGAMETQVRIGLLTGLWAACACDELMHQTKTSTRDLVYVSAVIAFSINIFGTLYSMAMIPAIFLLMLLRLLKNRKLDRSMTTIAASWFVCVVLYVMEYRLLTFGETGKSALNSGKIFGGIARFFLHPRTSLMALCSYNGSSVLGYAGWIDHKIDNRTYLWVGAFITLLMLCAVFCFFYFHMYEKTWLPLLLIGYTELVFVLVSVGRENNWEWFVNEWYQTHTRFGLIATVWILCWSAMKIKRKAWKALLAGSLGISCIMLGFGYTWTIQRAPSVKGYYERMQQYLFAVDESELPVDANGLTPLVASLDQTMYGINVMKKYNLSVYQYYEPRHKMEILTGRAIGTTLDQALKTDDIYDDGWVGKKATIDIRTGASGQIVLEGYCPFDLRSNETVSVYVNGEKFSEQPVEKEFKIYIDTGKSNSIVEIQLVCNYTYPAQAPDTRDLCFVLSDLCAQEKAEQKSDEQASDLYAA